MKILLALSLVLVACSTVPSAPSGCQAVGDCQAETKMAYLGPDKTVMLMLQSPTLIGGKAADPVEWPASIYAKTGASACSATLVGDRVLFMAAHCMTNGEKVYFTAHSNAYTATCTHHPEYKGNPTADWALCLVDRPVTGVPFEVMGVGQLLAVNQTLTLSGYGCIKPGGGGGNDGIFRTGEAKITGLPHGPTYDVVTRGGAALCFGDSGGAAYVVSPTGVRYVVAVNSRGDIATKSFLPSVASDTFKRWAKEWARVSNNVQLCGMHEDAIGCRQGEAVPKPDGKFEVTGRAACVRGAVRVEYLGKKTDIVEAVKAALDKF